MDVDQHRHRVKNVIVVKVRRTWQMAPNSAARNKIVLHGSRLIDNFFYMNEHLRAASCSVP